MRPFFLACLFLISCATRGAAACDPTTISGVLYYTDADSAVVENPAHGGDLSFSSVEGFDFHTGRFFGHPYRAGCSEVARVAGSDAYRIQGAPAGVSVPIHIELRIYMVSIGYGPYQPCGGLCDSRYSGGLFASMYGPQGAGDSLQFCFCGEITRSIDLDLAVIPEEEFSIRYFVWGSVGYGAFNEYGRVEANIRFTGVPPSAQLVSCHGVNDEAVLAKPSTWGRVKATYR